MKRGQKNKHWNCKDSLLSFNFIVSTGHTIAEDIRHEMTKLLLITLRYIRSVLVEFQNVFTSSKQINRLCIMNTVTSVTMLKLSLESNSLPNVTVEWYQLQRKVTKWWQRWLGTIIPHIETNKRLHWAGQLVEGTTGLQCVNLFCESLWTFGLIAPLNVDCCFKDVYVFTLLNYCEHVCFVCVQLCMN